MANLELLIATKNVGKIKELEKLLSDLPVILRNAGEFKEIVEPEETGKTFAENAILKAQYYAKKTGLLALADDSGLEVAALNNAPGIFSARYAGSDATNQERIARLLIELEQTKDTQRLAKFVCAVAISDKTGEIRFLTEGICSGKIAGSPQGTNGFGYDPIFVPDDFSQTFGELSDEIKQKISHRGRAMKKIIEFLSNFLIP